ncbi:MAG: hypothetical protein ABIP81_03700, partial [Terriglobales bacterium]
MQSVPRQVITLILASLMLSLVAVGQTPPTPAASADAEKLKAESRAETNAAKDGQDQPSATKSGATKAQQNPEADIVPGKKKPTGPPTTKTLVTPKEIVAADALLAPPPPPKGKIALIGGQVKNIDQIRNRMEVSIFGGGKMKMVFDERSHFYRDNVEVTQLAVKKGDRVYVDSQLDQGKIFARSVRVQSERPIAAASGQVIAYNPNSGDLTLREPISSKPLQFKVTPRTAFRRGDQPGAVADLRNNAIVRVTFLPIPGKRSELKDVDLIAVPGTKFTFYGTLTHIDLRNGLLGVENKSDDRLYEVRFRPDAQTVN